MTQAFPSYKPKCKMGRPTKLTQEISASIYQTICTGNFRDVAARHAGITPRTLIGWTTRGKKEETGIYADFLHVVLNTEADAEIVCVQRIIKASATDPKHARWWLERRFPERWSPYRQELNQLRNDLRELVAQLATIASGG